MGSTKFSESSKKTTMKLLVGLFAFAAADHHEIRNGICMHLHDNGEGHRAAMIMCDKNKPPNVNDCEEVPFSEDDMCPIEPNTEAGYDIPAYQWCALGQPVGGLTYQDKPGCKATTRPMTDEDVQFYNDYGQVIEGVTGTAKGKIFNSEQEFCKQKCEGLWDVESAYKPIY